MLYVNCKQAVCVVYCKQALCRRELFSDLTDGLMQQDSPLTQRRVAVYLISVLVANNSKRCS